MVLRRERSRRRVQEVEELAGTGRPQPSRGQLRRWWRRRQPIKSATVWTHRWTALVLGLVLLVVCTSGVPLLLGITGLSTWLWTRGVRKRRRRRMAADTAAAAKA
jgi:hypothetical protein